MSLRARFVLLAAVLCGALAVLVALSSIQLGQILEDQLGVMGKEAAQEGAVTVTQYLERFKTLALSVGAVACRLWEKGALSSALDLEPYLQDVFASQRPRGVSNVYVALELDGTYAEGKGWRAPDSYDARVRPWYRKAVRYGGPVVVDPYMDLGINAPVLSVVTPVRDARGRLVGVAGADVNLKALATLVKDRRTMGEGFSFLVNEDGDFLVGPRDSWALRERINVSSDAVTGEMARFGIAMLQNRRGVGELTIDGAPYRVFHLRTPDGLKFSQAFPMSSLRSKVAATTRQYALFSLGFAALILGVVLLLLRGIRQSLRGLLEATREVGQRLSPRADLERTAFSLNEVMWQVWHQAEASKVSDVRVALGHLASVLGVLARQQQELTAYGEETYAMNEALTDNNRVLQQREATWARVLDIARTAIASDRFSEGVRHMAEVIQEATGAFGVAVVRLEEGGLCHVSGAGYQNGVTLESLVPLEGSVAGRAFRLRETQWVNSVQDEKEYFLLHPRVMTEVEIPLIQAGEALGVVEVAFDTPRPYDPDMLELLTPITSALAGFLHGEKAHREVRQSYNYLAERLLVITGIYHDETAGHLQRMGGYCHLLASEWGRSEEEQGRIALFARLHDIGKVRVPMQILGKPGPLTKEEFDTVKKHPEWGAEILGDAAWLAMARQICLTHHEKWDGSGYPRGLRGEDIPWEGQVTALADIYDALRARRVYKPPMSHEEAVRVLLEGDRRVRPEHFNPVLLEIFRHSASTMDQIFRQFDE
ncbi:MAG TPA: cache domain-containing protein [Synergistaceae bacterium]|nr:cache domain-containing protein [Synergistaceae bacterium]